MAAEPVYLLDIRLLGRNDANSSYYTGPTASCPPLPKVGEQIVFGSVNGEVTALSHEREDFPGYVVFHLDISVNMSDVDDELIAFDGRLQASGRFAKLKDFLVSE